MARQNLTALSFPLLSNIVDLLEGNDRIWEGVDEISCATSVRSWERVRPSRFQPPVRCSGCVYLCNVNAVKFDHRSLDNNLCVSNG